MKFSFSDAYLINPVTNERLEGWSIDESSSCIHAMSYKHIGNIEKLRGCSFLLKDDFNTKTLRCWRVVVGFGMSLLP